ncbi:MYG1 exonuclease [Mustelus asterias]
MVPPAPGFWFRRGLRLSQHMAAVAEKRPRPRPRIGTHDGTFHCDEALACFLLRRLPEYQDAEIIRSRDPVKLATCNVVVDVGGIYDSDCHRYDHHQRSFSETMSSLRPEYRWTTKLSSAGLVFFHFGRRILAQLVQTDWTDPRLDILQDKMYENFVEEIDAIDNGISQCDGEPRYSISTNLSSRVAHLNPAWNADSQDTEAGFARAMELVGSEFVERVDYYHKAWLPARTLVEDAVKRRYKEDSSGEIVVLNQGGCPWKEHLFELEKELQVPTPIKFVLYTDQRSQWRVQCVPEGLRTFQNRLSLPEQWRGLRDAELSTLSGIAGCVFVHASGFIGGNISKEGVLEMARATLRQAPGVNGPPAVSETS